MVAEAVRQVDADNQTTRREGEWMRVASRFREEIGEAAWRTWLFPLSVEPKDDGPVVVIAPDRCRRDWVATHYADRLFALWRAEDPRIEQLTFIVGRTGEAPGVSAAPREEPKTLLHPQASDGESGPVFAVGDGRGPPTPLDQRFTFDSFVVGKPNELAHAAARRVAEACAAADRTVPFNPLYLYGGVGLGKTHLMHAVAWHVRKHAPERKVIYLSAEMFMYQFIRALRFKSTMDFKEQFRSVDLLMIDDFQFIAGKELTQEEFFHTFNALVDQNRQIVISADKSPSDLEKLEERMRSRLGWGLVADLLPTTYELRLGILVSKVERSGLSIPQKVLELLAHKITSNIRELEGALNRITANMQLVGREITFESAQDELRDLLRSCDRRVTIDEIQRRVAEHFNMRQAEMFSDRRARSVARPRQVAMYLAKELTTRSLPEIGKKFGGRDHTTVIHAVRKIKELQEKDPALAEDVELLRRILQG